MINGYQPKGNKVISEPPKGVHSTLINDGGERISYGEGKAIREPSDGKGRYDLLSPFANDRTAKWMELGAKKYTDHNWENGGIPFSRFLDSALRHLNKFQMGMDDEDHLAAVRFNVDAIMHFQELKQFENDDLPHYLSKEKNIEKD